MSTTVMWLLLAVVVILIVFASVLYKRTFTVHELALTGVMAALSLVAYLFFRIPFYGGSSFHLGYFRNVFIFGQEYTVAQALSKIAGGVTLVNSVASTVCVVILYLALRPALERAKLLTKGETK